MLESLANLSNILGFAQNTAYIILYEWSYFNYLYLSIIFCFFLRNFTSHGIGINFDNQQIYYLITLYFFIACVGQPKSV